MIAQKGGAGKTALAINLAVASADASEPAAVIDLDPQASAAAWAAQRHAPAPAVHPCGGRQLARTLERSGAGLVVIDTAPRAEASALAAARAADLVLIPCRPALVDLHAVTATIEIAALAGAEAVAVLNAVPPTGTLADEARGALSGMGVRGLQQTIGQRVAFVHAYTLGLGVIEHRPRSRAAAEIRALHDLVAAPARAAAA
ncbi:MAG: AAA family ATPase [Rhodospirillaceae bacterium]|nr:AAA family ATPase [Rhodospirillaceae bacterium]